MSKSSSSAVADTVLEFPPGLCFPEDREPLLEPLESAEDELIPPLPFRLTGSTGRMGPVAPLLAAYPELPPPADELGWSFEGCFCEFPLETAADDAEEEDVCEVTPCSVCEAPADPNCFRGRPTLGFLLDGDFSRFRSKVPFRLRWISLARLRSTGLGLQSSQRYLSGTLDWTMPTQTACCHTRHRSHCIVKPSSSM